MRIDVVTLFPPMFDAVTGYGVVGRAVKREILQLGLWNPRDFTQDNHRTVDDRPYGGGPGMVMLLQPLREAVAAARAAAVGIVAAENFYGDVARQVGGADVAVVNTCCVTHEAVAKHRKEAARAARAEPYSSLDGAAASDRPSV